MYVEFNNARGEYFGGLILSSPVYYLTIDEMAALLRVSRKIIRGMIVRAEIPFIKVGRQIRIHIDVLKMFEGDADKEREERRAEYASRIEAMHAKLPYKHWKGAGTRKQDAD